MKKTIISAAVFSAVMFISGLLIAAGPPNGRWGGAGLPSGRIASLYCALTGCTFSGGVTFASTIDAQGVISDSSSSTCSSLAAGTVCVQDDNGLTVASATAASVAVNIKSNVNTGSAIAQFYDSSSVLSGNVGFINSANADADYANKVFIQGVSKQVAVLRSDDVAAGTSAFEIRDNVTAAGVQLVSVDGAGNITVNATGTRTKGTITLVAGTGTATVNSGAVCVCTDTTANASVRCAVASTTLTATGTGTDVIAYLCL